MQSAVDQFKSRGSASLIIYSIIGIIAIFALFSSIVTIDETERGVHLRNGKLIGTKSPGLGFKVPFIDTVEKISVQTHSVSYPKIGAYSHDQQPATIDVSVTFSVPPDRVTEVYANFKDVESLVKRTLSRQVPTQLENVFGKYTAISAVQKRAQLVIDLTNAIKAEIKGPIEIVSVQIEAQEFSPQYEANIEARMKAEVEVQTQQQTHEKEKIIAAIAVTKAQGEADSKLAIAKADAESIKLRGDAEAIAIKARAEALAKNQDLVELTKAEKWDGKLPTTMIPNTTLPFLTNK